MDSTVRAVRCCERPTELTALATADFCLKDGIVRAVFGLNRDGDPEDPKEDTHE